MTALASRVRPAGASLLVAAPTVAGAGVVAALLTAGHSAAAALVAAAPIGVCGLAAVAAATRRVGTRARMVGVTYALLLAGTFVWRVRTTQSLDSNPLDRAALVRIALVTTAGLLAAVFVFTTRIVRARVPTSLRFLLAYIVVAGVAALDSPRPLQAFYRVYELGLGFAAIMLALSLLGDRAGRTAIRIVVGAMGLLVAIVWIEALAFPSRAWSPTVSVFPYELQGYLPAYSTNAVGTFGGFLAIWGLVRPEGGRWMARLALVGGTLTLLAAQYRTGIIGFLAAVVVVGWRRNRLSAILVPVAVALAIGFFGWHTISGETTRVFAKGRPELVYSLDSRTVYWHAALPLIRQRPFFGWGLDVASRQVLVSLGDNSTSTIHSTWVEAVLGTGVIGAALLALAYLTATARALRASRDRMGLAVGAMLVYMVVRSLTGTTSEIFDVGFVVFASLALVAEQIYAREREPPG